jgi:hypothetical protein
LRTVSVSGFKGGNLSFTKSFRQTVHVDTVRWASPGISSIIFMKFRLQIEDKNIFAEQLIYENNIGIGVYSSDFILIRSNQA